VTRQAAEGAQDMSSSDVPVELLVVLGPGGHLPSGGETPPPEGPGRARPAPPPTPPLTGLEALRGVVPVSGDCPPRLALVPLPASAVPRIEALPYVVGAYGAAPPAGVLAALGDVERLFVTAWLERVDAASGQGDGGHGDDHRRGQGLPWDAPGYEPPDAPGSARPA